MHASESVLVVGELLCAGVQANTEKHTKNGTCENVLMLGIQTTVSSTNALPKCDLMFDMNHRSPED